MTSRSWLWIGLAVVAVLVLAFLFARRPAATPEPTTAPPAGFLPTATFFPSSTPGPLATVLASATPARCTDNTQFIKDVTVPDGSVMLPGQQFNKTWRIKNTGTCAWDSSYGLAFAAGNAMSGQPAQIQGIVSPDTNYDVTVGMTAPTQPGDAQGWWQMVNSKTVAFGPRLWVDVYVIGPATAKPPTPVSPPTPAAKPEINSFTAEPAIVDQDGQIVVKWSFSGTGLSAAILTRTDPDGTVVPLMGGADVPPKGQYEDIAANAGTVTYALSVTNEIGNVTEKATVTVMPLSAVQLPAGATPTP
jgi:hypothetical protein